MRPGVPLGHISWFPVLSSVGTRPAGSPRGGRSVAMARRLLRQLETGRASPASIRRPVPSKGYEQKQRERAGFEGSFLAQLLIR